MKKMNFLLLVLLSFSCGENDINSKSYNINIEKICDNFKEQKISSIASNVNVVALDTNEKCILGAIKQIKIHKNEIYVLDNQSKLLVFDLSGKYSRRIVKVGKGYDELLRVDEFDCIDDTLLLYSSLEGILKFYNYEGAFLGKKIACKNSSSFLYNNGNVLFYIPAEMSYFVKEINNRLTIVNSNGTVAKKLIELNQNEKPEGFRAFLNSARFKKENKNIYISWQGSNKIYLLNGLECKELIHFNLGKYQAQKDWLDNFDKYQENKLKFSSIDNFLLLGKNLYFSYKHKNMNYRIFNYNLLESNGYNIGAEDKNGFIDDFTNGPQIIPQIIDYYYFIEFFDKMRIDEIFKNDKLLSNKDNRFYDVSSKISYDSNPVLRITFISKTKFE